MYKARKRVSLPQPQVADRHMKKRASQQCAIYEVVKSIESGTFVLVVVPKCFDKKS